MPQNRKQMEIAHVQLKYYSYRRVDSRVITIDEHIWKEVSKYHWYLIGGDDAKKTYVCCGPITRPTYLHRLAWEMTYQQAIPDGLVIDHIDGNTLNTCTSNLRCVTKSDNSLNRDKPRLKRASTSKYKSVWGRHHRRKDGSLIRSYVAEFNVKGFPKKTKTFSAKKYGATAEKLAAKWVNEQWQINIPNGCYRLNEISDTEDDDAQSEETSSSS
jgi:hypothetical protein